MLLLVAVILAAVSGLVLLLYPPAGLLAIYLVRPIVDTAWQDFIFLGFKLTELVSVSVPLITFLLILMNMGTHKSVAKMPFVKFWVVYLLYISIFCINIGISSSIKDAANVFFRFANGFVGFYLVQAYFSQKDRQKYFFFILVLAGIFPIATGVYEAITGAHWKVTYAEGQIRGIGLYHDAITIRYYALQTILAIAACLAIQYPRNIAFRVGLIALLGGALTVVFKALSKSGLAILFIWGVLWSYGRRSILVPSLALIAALFVIPYYFDAISETVYNVFHKEIGAIQGDVSVNRTFAGRWLLWESMMNEWLGFDALSKLFGSGEITLYSHNDYLQMLFHGGLFGLALYIGFLFAIGWKLVVNFMQSGGLLNTLALMAYTMWLVDTIGLIPSLYTGYQWFVWGVIGLYLRTDMEYRISSAQSREANEKLQTYS